MEHSQYNEKCPINDPETFANPATAGLPCTCKEDGFRNEDDVINLSGQDMLDALTTAWKSKHYKGWTYKELLMNGGVLTVYDEEDKIIRYECIASTHHACGKG